MSRLQDGMSKSPHFRFRLSIVYISNKIKQKGIAIYKMTQTPQSDSNQQKAQVQDYFSRTAEGYVASFSHRTGDDLQRLIELGEWGPGQLALDIATGGGHTALEALIVSPAVSLRITFQT